MKIFVDELPKQEECPFIIHDHKWPVTSESKLYWYCKLAHCECKQVNDFECLCLKLIMNTYGLEKD